MAGLIATKVALARQKSENLVESPEMANPYQLAIIEIISKVRLTAGWRCYWEMVYLQVKEITGVHKDARSNQLFIETR